MAIILVGCEESQVICIEFRKHGYEAYSCDLKPCSGGHPEWHLQMDVFEAIKILHPKMGIFHPPCTRLANSGVLRLYINGKMENGIDPVKWEEMVKGALFFKKLLYSDIEYKVIENPVMHHHALDIIGQFYSQTIQPWMFGEDASKRTCLWLVNLPLLLPTLILNKKKYSNQTPSGQNKIGHGPERAAIRSKTYPGIAKAMADQWSPLIN